MTKQFVAVRVLNVPAWLKGSDPIVQTVIEDDDEWVVEDAIDEYIDERIADEPSISETIFVIDTLKVDDGSSPIDALVLDSLLTAAGRL